MVFGLVVVEEDKEPLEPDSSLVYKFCVCRVYGGLKFSSKGQFLTSLDFKCLKLLYLYVKITLYYVKKSNIMYESNCVQNQILPTHKRHKQSNATSNGSQQLDIEYLQIRDQIMKSDYYRSLQKQAKIRLKAWISKLDTIITNSVWKKNRNHYAKLINLMCQCEILISPFTALPPHSDISTLTKHEINAMIDQVELAVKNNTLKAQNWLKEQLKQNNNEKETPMQHWSRVRQMKEKQESNYLDQSSIKQASSVNFASKYSQKRVKILNQSINYSQYSIKSMPLKFINLMQKQNIKPTSKHSNVSQKSIKISEYKLLQKQPLENQIPRANQIMETKLKTKVTQDICSSSFAKNKRIATNHTGTSQISQPSLNLREQFESIQMVDDTPQSQVCYNQSYESQTQKDTKQMNESHWTQCNFSDDFTERCRNKQEVLIQNYFSWKKTDQTTEVNKNLTQIQNRPIQHTNLHREIIQPSNSITIDTILLSAKDTSFSDDSKMVQLSQSYQKQYWESDNVSCDFNYRQEGEIIQINQCEQQEIADQVPMKYSKHLGDFTST